jgi:hypothetical protein
MEWVESPGKGRNASALLREFEERFARLSTLDRTVLDTSRILLLSSRWTRRIGRRSASY